MRVGSNPFKDKENDKSRFTHQVVVPVYIPEIEGYFQDAIPILDRCISSLHATVHSNTLVTVVNNGSCTEVREFLDTCLKKGWIHELEHVENIGKVNAVLKGMVGNTIDLVTITDADVLFLKDWQQQTYLLFEKMPKVGIVGLIPQFRMFHAGCDNMLADNLLNSDLCFLPVKDADAMAAFYDSIGWKRDYNPDYLKYGLGFTQNGESCYVGNGHVVATYKKHIFQSIACYIPFKMGGGSENYLDQAGLIYDYWRVTTYRNMAFHMGNTLEPWMEDGVSDENTSVGHSPVFLPRKRVSRWVYFLKNRLFHKLFFQRRLMRKWMRIKGLPKEVAQNY